MCFSAPKKFWVPNTLPILGTVPGRRDFGHRCFGAAPTLQTSLVSSVSVQQRGSRRQRCNRLLHCWRGSRRSRSREVPRFSSADPVDETMCEASTEQTCLVRLPTCLVRLPNSSRFLQSTGRRAEVPPGFLSERLEEAARSEKERQCLPFETSYTNASRFLPAMARNQSLSLTKTQYKLT